MDSGLFSVISVLSLNAQDITAETLHNGALIVLALLAVGVAYMLYNYTRHQTAMLLVAAVVLAAGAYKVWEFDGYVRTFVELCDKDCQSTINSINVERCRFELVRGQNPLYVKWRKLPFGGIFDSFDYHADSSLLNLHTSRLRVADYDFDGTCTLDTVGGTILMTETTQREAIVP